MGESLVSPFHFLKQDIAVALVEGFRVDQAGLRPALAALQLAGAKHGDGKQRLT